MNLTMQERLNCPRSYADEQSQHLLCEMGGVCDGTLYDCCTWDKSFSEMMGIMARENIDFEPDYATSLQKAMEKEKPIDSPLFDLSFGRLQQLQSDKE